MRSSTRVIMCCIFLGGSWCEAGTKLLTMAKARQIALNAYAGKIESEELENEKGHRVYSFDIRRAGQAAIHEILLDAYTGEIISQTTETPAQQADEKKADMKK